MKMLRSRDGEPLECAVINLPNVNNVKTHFLKLQKTLSHPTNGCLQKKISIKFLEEEKDGTMQLTTFCNAYK